MSSSLFTTKIISAFPGLGQEILSSTNDVDKKIHFMDRSKYGFIGVGINDIVKSKGEKYNLASSEAYLLDKYIEGLLSVYRDKSIDFVFVNCDPQVHRALSNNNLKFSILCPINTSQMKEVVMGRIREYYKDDAQFLAYMIKKYDTLLNAASKDTKAKNLIRLTPSSIDNWYQNL
jgi:hypothetical protein